MAIATIEQAQQGTEAFLTGQMLEALRTVAYRWPRFDEAPQPVTLAEAARARVEVRHVRGASDAFYLIAAFMLEARRCAIALSPRQAGYAL